MGERVDLDEPLYMTDEREMGTWEGRKKKERGGERWVEESEVGRGTY